MKRYLDDLIAADLQRKLVFVTGPRQVGKTTLSQELQAASPPSVYLNYDITDDRALIERQGWPADSRLLVLDELHKMVGWKPWLKGIIDGRPAGQAQLVTGSARMDTFRQAGDSLAGRYLSWRLHPISVKEWCDLAPRSKGEDAKVEHAKGVAGQAGETAPTPEQALAHLLTRGGFPEPCLFPATPLGDKNALRWRAQYANGLVREDILEFSRIQEVAAMRVLLDLLRERVGSPLSLSSIGRDLGISAPTVKRFIDILEALYIVFTVQPWHHNIARSLMQAPKIYFYDTGMVNVPLDAGQPNMGARFENAVAAMLLKHTEFLQDSEAAPVGLHYLRNKDGGEIDFALSNGKALTHLIECKWADTAPHRAFKTFMPCWPQAQAVQLVRHARNPEQHASGLRIEPAAGWLAKLAA